MSDLWGTPREVTRRTAERKYGKSVSGIYVSSGLWADIEFSDGSTGVVFPDEISKYGSKKEEEMDWVGAAKFWNKKFPYGGMM